MPEALIAVLVLAAVLWMWRENLEARETATRAGRKICAAHDVQFLDETVALAKMNLGWNGRFALLRSYRFEYSVDGADRAAGFVVIQGGRILHVQLATAGPLH